MIPRPAAPASAIASPSRASPPPSPRRSARPAPKAKTSSVAIAHAVSDYPFGFANFASSMFVFALMSVTFSVSSVFQFVRLISNGIFTPLTTR